MTLYFDSSAWAKSYLPEAGSREVDAWRMAGRVVTSRLTSVEVASAAWRRVGDGQLEPKQAESIVLRLFRDLEAALMVELTAEVAHRAADLFGRHRLRAGDAIQLASALWFRASVPEAVEFIAFDARLNRAARAEGLPTPAVNL